MKLLSTDLQGGRTENNTCGIGRRESSNYSLRILGRSLSLSSKKRRAIGEEGSYSLHKVIVGGGDADSKDNGGRPGEDETTFYKYTRI